MLAWTLAAEARLFEVPAAHVTCEAGRIVDNRTSMFELCMGQ